MQKIILICATLLFYSNTATSQWVKCHSFKDSNINCLAYNSNTNSLFAGTTNGIYKSNDGGTTWVKKSLGDSSNLSTFNLICVGNRIVGTNLSGVFYSDDDAESWHSTSINQAMNLRFDPYQKRLYTGFSFLGGMSYSSDTSKTWKNQIIPDGYPILAHVEKDSLLICATYKDVYVGPTQVERHYQVKRSTNLGATYSLVASLYVNSIVLTDSVIIGINGQNVLYKSFNSGLIWETDTSLKIGGMKSIYESYNRFVIVGGGNGGIYFSKDKTVIWDTITANFQGIASNFIQIGDTLFAVSDSTIWKRNIAFLDGINIDPRIQKTLFVYPNPTDGLFSIQIPDKYLNYKTLELNIYNNMGQKIKNIKIDSGLINIQISMIEEPPGLYVIELINSGNSLSTKIIKNF